MEIRKINVDTSAVNGSNVRRQAEEKKEEKAPAFKDSFQGNGSVEPEKVLDAMNLAGFYNQLNVHRSDDLISSLGLDPNDTFDEAVDKLLVSGKISQKNIDDIDQAVNGKFAIGVKGFADALELEFPDVFDEPTKNALAANIYARE